MDLFFVLSKSFQFIATPSHFLVMTLALALMVRLLVRRWSRRAEQFGVAAAIGLVGLGLTPAGDWLMAPLENRFPQRDAAAAAQAGLAPAGIILLGGGLGATKTSTGFVPDYNAAADRIRAAGAWARAFPQAPVFVSGGPIADAPGAPSEAALMADALVELGVAPDRIRREAHSRTTAENAAEIAKLGVRGDGWVLVTSAFHMPRAVATFAAAGVTTIPAPTDFRVDASETWRDLDVADNLETVDYAVKEWLGLLGYRLAGRSTRLFPGPHDAAPAR
jgi:uncharacterized SAM-binding protein YcdF (DUF218 family)